MRRPSHDVRNDGIGPYAVFHCEKCHREYRSSPAIAASIAKSAGREVASGLLRRVPIAGSALRHAVPDARYVRDMTPAQLDTAWQQVQVNFHECPTCMLVVCHSDWDAKSGYCRECTPRRGEIAQAETEQAVGVIKGIASAFGLDQAAKAAMEQARQQQQAQAGAVAPGQAAPSAAPSAAPAGVACAGCGTLVTGKFCPECGAKVEPPKPAVCPGCGVEAQGAKFCPECGTKIG